MKTIFQIIKGAFLKISVTAFILFASTSCDEGFEEMNINPNAYTQPVIGNLFTYSIIRTAGTGTADRNRVMIKHISGMIQYMATLQTFWYGEKYLYHDQGGNYFENAYANQLKELQQIFPIVQEDPELINHYAMARIWRVYIMHKVTDIYGDVPYSEAAKGFTQGILKPQYDSQSTIYADMLNELEVAASQLDPTKSSFGASDLIYKGDPVKWKTFAYSLMLRLGMRLTEVDQDMAQNWVQKAISGGVMQNNQDVALLRHVDGHPNTRNQDAWELQRESFPPSARGLAKVKVSKTLIDMLQERSDPRLPFYVHLWNGNSNPQLQKGLPNGQDDATISNVIPGWSNARLVEYSEPNNKTIASMNSPSVFLSYSEVEFLLAEAALRTWADGNPADHYNAAISASMEATDFYPGEVAISLAQINAYLSNHPLLGTVEEQMEKIHTQIYISQFMYFEFFESWSNWRRTGYPVLTPVDYPGNDTGGLIPRRLRYPQSEASLNTTNYEAANQRQGPDLLMTRVWWDVE